MNQKDTNELKRGAGYLKEKAIIGLTLVTGDDLDRAIMKVTSHMLKAPKEKHLQRLLATTYGHYKSDTRNGKNICDYIVSELEKRMHTHNWIVVLKTLVTLHRLMTDGSDEINSCIQRNRNIFCVRNLKDLSETPEGAAQSLFIRRYLGYLEERVITQETIGINNRLESVEFSSVLRSLDVGSLTPLFEALLGQLSALVEVDYRESIVDNFCTLEAYQKLVDDGKILYQLLSNRVIFILDGFGDFPLPLKKKWLELYQQYSVLAERLRTLFDSMNNSSKVFSQPPPQLKALPNSLLTQLEDDVRLSSIPKEDMTETLESLGISSVSRKKEKENTFEQPSSSLRKAAEEPLPVKEPPSLPPPPPPVTKTEDVTFSMDDLFVGPPAATAQLEVPLSLTDPPQVHQDFPFLNPQSDGNLEAQAFGNNYTSASAPVDDGWSSGAPISWEPTPPVQFSTLPQATNDIHHTTWGGPPSISKDDAPKKDTANVFKELCNDGKKGWYSTNM